MKNNTRMWWLPGMLVGAVGILAIFGGLSSGGPDALGGLIFGGVAIAAAGVILWRRTPVENEVPPADAAGTNQRLGD